MSKEASSTENGVDDLIYINGGVICYSESVS